MADDPTPKRPGPEPASDAKKHANKLVVLSSVAKPPMNEEDSLLGEPDPSQMPASPPDKAPESGLIRPVGWTTRPGGATTIIKLPPKTGVLPRLTSLGRKAVPPPLPPPEIGEGPGTALAETDELPLPRPETIAPASTQPAPEIAPAPAKKAGPPPLPPQPEKARLLARPEPISPKPAAPEPSRVEHVPPLVPAHAPTREAAAEAKSETKTEPGKADPLAQTVRFSPPPAETPRLSRTTQKHRLPPRASVARRAPQPPIEPVPAEKPVGRGTGPVAIPPKVYPIAPPAKGEPGSGPAAPSQVKPQRASVTPPTVPLNPGTGTVKPPTIPLKAAPVPSAAFVRSTGPAIVADKPEPGVAAGSRAEKRRKRRMGGIIAFYVLFAALVPCLYYIALAFVQETRVEGQIIPPPGMQLANEAWIVTDFRSLATGIASDLADNRQIVLQEMQEKLGHVQHAQADVATREARIRLIKDQIAADQDEQLSLVKQARAAAQQVWDGPGAQLDAEYQSRLTALNQAISDRAKANRLNYQPNPAYYSPEVWANAYRIALYEVPAGVDPVKERAWLDDQMKAWHAFTKATDQKQIDLREQATQLKLAPASKVADLKQQIEDLQQRIDGTIAEEEPLKAELEQAQADLAAVQTKEAGLDAKPFAQLDALPEQNVIKRLPVRSNGRFSWREVEKESKYGEGERSHVFWIFVRAYRSDGRQFWSLHRFNVDKNSPTELTIEPDSFVSTRAILRPDLSPDEQAR